MKTVLLLTALFWTSVSFSQDDRIGFIYEPDTSTIIWLKYFHILGQGDPDSDTIYSLVDSTHFEYFPLDNFTYVRQWYHLPEGTTVELIAQMDGSWLYVQKRGDKELFYGKCLPQLSDETGYMIDSHGEDSLVSAKKLLPEGTWSYYYKNILLTGKYEGGRKVGSWEEYRPFRLFDDLRNVKYAVHYYQNDWPASSRVFSLIGSEEVKQLVRTHDWDAIPTPDMDYQLFCSGNKLLNYTLLRDGTIRIGGRGSVPPKERLEWSYDEKKNILRAGTNACKVVFVNDEVLILKWIK